MYSDSELYHIGMSHLIEKLGKSDTDRFISIVTRGYADYSVERARIYEGMTLEEMLEEAARYEKEHPPVLKKAKIL